MKKGFKKRWANFLIDMGKLFFWPLIPWLRIRKVHVSGEKFRSRVKGPVLIVANHSNLIDPVYVGVTFWTRRLHFLAAEVVMDKKVIGPVLRTCGCIRIDRNASDINAIRQSVAILKGGQCLAMFPQGSVQQSSEVDKIKAGAILIAMQADVPILPMYVVRRAHWWQRQRVVLGDYFYCRDYCDKKFPSMQDIASVADKLLEKMEACKKTYEQSE